MAERVPMTPRGAQLLRDFLVKLRAERPKISKEIGIAIDHGDLKENAEYHAAKERQGIVEAHIKSTEDKLGRSEVIDPSKLEGSVIRFGATVELTNVDSEEEFTYQIVGADEADIDKGLLSISAPIARALIGREAGDEVTIKLPVGNRTFEIGDVSYH